MGSQFEFRFLIEMDSTTLYKFVGKLLNDKEFAVLATNADRVAYAMDRVLAHDVTTKVVKTNLDKARMKTRKSRSRAEEYLEKAELYMKEKRFDDAMKTVHKAIVHVPVDEVNLRVKLYAVKSNIHTAKREGRQALYAIQMAASIKDQLQMDLVLLQLNCLIPMRRFGSAIELIDRVLDQEDSFWEGQEFPKSSFERVKRALQEDGNTENFTRDPSEERAKHRQYFGHQMDKRCKIVSSPVVGRHFVATEDIPANTVLLAERPYSLWLLTGALQRKCSYCYHDLEHKLYPCHHCTEVAFCNENCFNAAWASYHRFECGIITLLNSLTGPAAHAFRIMSRIGPFQASQLEETQSSYYIEQYIADTEQRDVPEREKTQEEKNRQYQIAASLCDHNDKHSRQTNAYHTVLAIVVTILLELVNGLHLEQDRFRHFAELVIIGMRRIVFNVFGWHEFEHTSSNRNYVANCQCLVGSLINHSCVPNTTWEWRDGIIRFVSNVAIAKGSQITITYGPNDQMSYTKRQDHM